MLRQSHSRFFRATNTLAASNFRPAASAFRPNSLSRPYSTLPSSAQGGPKQQRSRLYRVGRAALLTIVGLPVVGGLSYFTYDTFLDEQGDVLHHALPPRRFGGPKNLVMTHGCDTSTHKRGEEENKDDGRQRLVVIGSGWGAISVVRQLEKKKYHVTLISPTTYFLFTPLLPSATVGTLELRSLVEPVRKILARLGGYFLEGKAIDVDFENQLVEVEGIHASEGRKFYVPYDKLVIAVGSESMTHGVEGLEHCHFLKSISDTRKIRKTVIENFEKASLPTTTEEERRQLLSFLIAGGGPTGVEFAAELYDFLNEDFVSYFPAIRPEEVKITVIQSASHILNTYDLKISQMAEEKFKRENIDVITNSRVTKVNATSVEFADKTTKEKKEIPFGLCLWATGVGMSELVKVMVKKLPSEVQGNKFAIETDEYMRVLGTPKDTVYAIGDCATIPQPHFVDKVMDYCKHYDTDGDSKLNLEEFRVLAQMIAARHRDLSVFLAHTDDIFELYDLDHNGNLDLDEIKAFLVDAEKHCKALPATAQVASQQGKYLGSRLNALERVAKDDIKALEALPAFEYKHKGSLAYIGGQSALLDFGSGYTYGGIGSEYLWRSAYFSEQVSWRTRFLLAVDWTKRAVFGRDISKF